MPARIGFSGFLTGSQVGLAAASQSRNTNAEGWGVASAAGTPRATIVPRRSALGVAPEGINFEVVLENFDTPGPSAATGAYDPQFHDIYYVWSFGDPGATFTAPQNILPEHRDANKAFGPLASHTFAAPGLYTVTVDAIEPASGKTARGTIQITVGDAETVFAGNRTLYVDPDSDFSAAPAGAQLFNDLQAAYVRAGQTTEPTEFYRIMLNRGKSYALSGGQMRGNYKNLWMCAAPGGGAKPIINASAAGVAGGIVKDLTTLNSPTRRVDIAFMDLDLRGLFDTTTETGTNEVFFRQYGEYCTYMLFHNIDATGFENLWYNPVEHHSGDTTTNVKIINNTSVTDCRNFCIFVQEASGLSLTGVRFTHHVEALSGGEKGGQGHNEHAGARLQRCYNVVVDASDFFSRSGWFENQRGIHTPQPCFRWNQLSNPSARLNMQRCHMEGGEKPLALSPQDANYPTQSHNILVDKCYLLAGAFATEVTMVDHAGATIRNCVLIHADADRSGSAGANPAVRFIRLNNATADPQVAATPFRAYNNTMIYRGTPARNYNREAPVELFTTSLSQDYTDVVTANNIRYLPNYTPADVEDAPLDETVIWTRRYADYRDWNHPHKSTLAADVPAGGTLELDYALFGAGLSAADFSQNTLPSRYNQFALGAAFQAISVNFGASAMTFTNESGNTWAGGSGFTAIPLRSAVHIRTSYGSPTDSVISGAPLSGSSALGAAVGGPVAVDDMLGNLRPAFPSIGAYELVQ